MTGIREDGRSRLHHIMSGSLRVISRMAIITITVRALGKTTANEAKGNNNDISSKPAPAIFGCASTEYFIGY
jgi:hypothetical protein